MSVSDQFQIAAPNLNETLLSQRPARIGAGYA